ncbi:MAG: thiamine phosphate synthase [Lentisphaeria bacterium]|nr:thiamine phosphate synthase [Lentisphaeria bacterium]
MSSALRDERIARFAASDIYPVISPEFCSGRSVVDVLAGIAEGGAKVVQIRAKHASTADLFALVKQCRLITDRYRMLLIVDDRLDVALAAGADGVHLGQEDLPVADAVRIAPDLLIGCSTHNPEEIAKAQADGCGYLNIGPVYPTQTKAVSCGAVGVENMLNWRRQVRCPHSVMGGIKEQHLPELIGHGVRHIAMVTEITQAPDVAEKVRQLRKYFV